MPTQLNVTKRLIAVFLFLCSMAAGAGESTGDLYVFVFKDGLAQSGSTVNVGDVAGTTNIYGLARFTLPSDHYVIAYLKDGKPFAATDVDLVDGQSSQVFLTLTRNGADVELDLPLSAYTQNFEQRHVEALSGPKGTLKLALKDGRDRSPVRNARLFVKGYAVEAASDDQGIATLDLPKGQYDISVVHPKYVMQVIRDVAVKVDMTQSQEAKLVKSDIVMDEYVVAAPAVEGSLASTFTAMKDSSVISDALSREQFSKSGDSSAASALKRVTGITLVGGKYVYVRGLGERYSMVMLNDLHMPSPEPTKRVVPLDIFPTGVIQSMNIQKTYSGRLPGTFAGGDVLIISKDIPEEDNYLKLSVGTSVGSYTGKDVVYNADNSKAMPANIIAKSDNFQELQKGYPSLGVEGYTQEELDEINSQIVNYRRYNLQKKTVEPGKKIAVDIGQSFKTRGGLKYGFVGTVYASTDADYREATKYNSFYDIPTETLSAGERSDYQQSVFSEKQGGLLSLGIDTQQGTKLKYTYLTFDDTANSTTYSEKDGGPQGPGIDDQHRTYYEYVEKSIKAHQLSGGHHLNIGLTKGDVLDDLDIAWAAETAEATRYEPGTVEYLYERTSDVTDYTLDKKIWYLYSDLRDEVDNYRLDMRLPYRHKGRPNYTSLGLFQYNKSRTLDNRRFKLQHSLGTDVFEEIDDVLTQVNVDSGDLVLTSNYRPADAYTAKQDVSAFYIQQLFSVTEQLDLFTGVRQESSFQQLIDTESGVPYDPLETDDLLASASINYSFNDEHKLRLGFANTLSRPDFREFSPNRYKDPITEDIVFGYPGLEYTTIDNYDLKYDWYMSYDEVLSLGLFRKEFTNPVETIVNQDPNSQTGKKIISYRNAEGATSTGVEVGFRKRMAFLGRGWSNYFVEGNYALIDSNITLDENSKDPMISELTTTDRPMQGQSPYVYNIKLGYDNLFTGRSAMFLYNEYGKRIVALGSFGAPDYYEYPFQKLDFVMKWQLNDTYDEQVKKIGYTLTFKAKNLLDSPVTVKQGSQTIEQYYPGRNYSLGFSMKY